MFVANVVGIVLDFLVAVHAFVRYLDLDTASVAAVARLLPFTVQLVPPCIAYVVSIGSHHALAVLSMAQRTGTFDT
jgi:hypothetical protein